MKFVGNAVKRFLIYLIRAYRFYTSDRAPCCRYTPSCSAYAIEAINTHGAFLGALLAMWRLLRCNPFSRGGYDPVPPKGRLCGRHASKTKLERGTE